MFNQPKPTVGFTGYARSGKDTAGGILVQRHGYVRDFFAKVLKDVAYDVDPFVQLRDGTFVRYAELVDQVGVDAAKEHPDVRRYLQRLGTEGGRKHIHPDVWVRPVMERALASSSPVVITDVRFPNEVAAVQSNGGIVIRVNRPGFEPVNAHASDTGIADLHVDFDIDNDGTIDDLAVKVETILGLGERLRTAV